MARESARGATVVEIFYNSIIYAPACLSCHHFIISPKAPLQNTCLKHHLSTSPVDPTGHPLLRSLLSFIAVSQPPTPTDTPCQTIGLACQKARYAAHRPSPLSYSRLNPPVAFLALQQNASCSLPSPQLTCQVDPTDLLLTSLDPLLLYPRPPTLAGTPY